MILSRVYRFSASHRLHTALLSPGQNADLFGKCNNPYGHGHNYVLELGVKGAASHDTGRVVNVGALDRFVQQNVLEAIDHKDLNRDVPDFADVVPTTENLTAAIDRRLRIAWPFAPAELVRVHIQETPRNTFELRSQL